MDQVPKTRSSLTVNIVGLIVVAALGALFYVSMKSSDDSSQSNRAESGSDIAIVSETQDVTSTLSRSGIDADFSQSSIPFDQILSGGPGKDGIPAISDPRFTQLQDAEGIPDAVQVMVVQHGGETKLYPYNILVWHEIVNDTVGGKPLAITFCPLCGSAIVFERDVEGQVLEFGVSGLLYESNLLMYSREDSENLWSQARGEAVVGARTGTKLAHHPTQVITFGDARERFPDAVVMDTNTGSNRDYGNTPYSGYEDTEDTIFPVSVQDKRFPAKEIFYVVPLEGSSIAVRQNKQDGTYEVPDTDITVTFDRGLVTANWGDAVLPGYFEMWFSWAAHNNENGIVLE